MKIDPYKHKERYLNWRRSIDQGVPGLSRANSQLTIRYLEDMENGLNVSTMTVKGPRSYIRLNTLREKMVFFSRKFKEVYNLNCITEINEEQLLKFFSDLRKGIIKRNDGKDYKSVAYFVKVFKAFWHWHMKVNKKNKKEIPDITADLDTRQEKPKWVYLTEEQVKKLCDEAKYEYKVLILFLFDSGIRSPTELVNVRVSDFFGNFKEVQIREEVSKTFGRKIKLMISSDLIKDYVKTRGLNEEDYVFSIKPTTVNKYLQRLAERILGDKESLAGQKYSELTMYDFRHISCCYWLPRYKSESALKYRFGWKSSDKIHYYSEMLGMKDTISEEDLLIDTTKTEIEIRLTKTEREKELLQERVNLMESQMKEILEMIKEGDRLKVVLDVR
jgi:hypothetical protein